MHECYIPRKLYSRTTPKPQFPHNLILVLEDFAYSSGIIPRSNIVRDGLFFDPLSGRDPDEVWVGEIERFPSFETR